jgi:primosomal protein N'
MFIAHVIPLKRGIPFDTVTYFSAEDLAPGTIVAIPLQSKEILGLVRRSESALSAKSTIRSAPFKLKKIASIIGFSERFAHALAALETTQTLTCAPLGSILSSVLSPAVGELSQTLLLGKNEPEQIRAKKEHPAILISGTRKERIDEYRTRIRAALAKHEHIVFVAPTNFDARNLFASLAKGISRKVELLTSDQSVTKTKETLSKILADGDARAIIMTPAFAALSPDRTSLIVIEEESSRFYASGDRFKIDTRLFIQAFAKAAAIPLAVGDSLPRFETLARMDTKKLSVPVTKHFFIVEPPETKHETILSEPIMQLLAESAAQKKNVWIMAHRKGLAPLSRCKDCGSIVRCPVCDMPLVLKNPRSGAEARYICQHCGHDESAATPCRTCKSWNIFPLRIGSDAIVEHVARAFPGTTVITHDLLVKQMKKKKREPYVGAFFVGTDAMLPYIETLAIAVIPFFDRLYATPSYETSEHVFQTLLQAHECASIGVYIQTKQSDNEILGALRRGTLRTAIAEELSLRKNLGFPPYGTLLRFTLTGRAADWPRASEAATALFSHFALAATALPVVRSSSSSMQFEQSWIIQTDDLWLSEHARSLALAIDRFGMRFAIERNPHYFV